MRLVVDERARRSTLRVRRGERAAAISHGAHADEHPGAPSRRYDREVVDAVRVPVIAHGDKAKPLRVARVSSSAAGVMVARED